MDFPNGPLFLLLLVIMLPFSVISLQHARRRVQQWQDFAAREKMIFAASGWRPISAPFVGYGRIQYSVTGIYKQKQVTIESLRIDRGRSPAQYACQGSIRLHNPSNLALQIQLGSPVTGATQILEAEETQNILLDPPWTAIQWLKVYDQTLRFYLKHHPDTAEGLQSLLDQLCVLASAVENESHRQNI
jgi:hypothetical protein